MREKKRLRESKKESKKTRLRERKKESKKKRLRRRLRERKKIERKKKRLREKQKRLREEDFFHFALIGPALIGQLIVNFLGKLKKK